MAKDFFKAYNEAFKPAQPQPKKEWYDEDIRDEDIEKPAQPQPQPKEKTLEEWVNTLTDSDREKLVGLLTPTDSSDNIEE